MRRRLKPGGRLRQNQCHCTEGIKKKKGITAAGGLFLAVFLMSACGAYVLPGDGRGGKGMGSDVLPCSGAAAYMGQKTAKLQFCGGYGYDFSGCCFYREEWDEEKESSRLGQYDGEGKRIRSYSLEPYVGNVPFFLEIALVNETDIYLVATTGDSTADEWCPSSLWRIPLSREEGEERPCLRQMERILAEDSNIRIYYIGESCIAYETGGEYREYNRKKGETVSVGKDSKDRYCLAAKEIRWRGEKSHSGYAEGDMVLLARIGKSGHQQELYLHRIGSGKAAESGLYAEDRECVQAGFGEERCFITHFSDMLMKPHKSGRDNGISDGIFSCDYATGEKSCLVSADELEQWIEKQEFWMEESTGFQTGKLYLSDGRLYMILYIEEKNDFRACWIRVDTEDASLHYEKSLTEAYLKNDAYIQGMSGSQICFSPDNTDDFFVYGLETGEIKRVGRGSVEYGCWEGGEW